MRFPCDRRRHHLGAVVIVHLVVAVATAVAVAAAVVVAVFAALSTGVEGDCHWDKHR